MGVWLQTYAIGFALITLAKLLIASAILSITATFAKRTNSLFLLFARTKSDTSLESTPWRFIIAA